MKNIKTVAVGLTLLMSTVVLAQNSNEGKIIEETKKKSYSFYEDGKKVENSVRITSIQNQPVMTSEEDKNEINQERVFPPKTVTKRVEIDNDADEKYDEIIEFSYITEIDTDFTLVSDAENLMVAIDNGENLTIMKDMTISKENSYDSKKAYVFTDDNGKKIEFYISSVNWDENNNRSK